VILGALCRGVGFGCRVREQRNGRSPCGRRVLSTKSSRRRCRGDTEDGFLGAGDWAPASGGDLARLDVAPHSVTLSRPIRAPYGSFARGLRSIRTVGLLAGEAGMYRPPLSALQGLAGGGSRELGSGRRARPGPQIIPIRGSV